MDMYTVPDQTRIGHVHLKVANLDRALRFYRDLLGFTVTTLYGDQAAFISAGGYHHHIGLNTWYSKDAGPAPLRSAGLFHTAILYPTRRDLAVALKRLVDAKYSITGASDHGVSEAIYLNDPDQNGVELYWDRPKEQWPKKPDGSLEMYTHPLDLDGLLAEL
ncbi:VOC family protein [Spirosoma rigui]|uniref:VOC family protein n=1 Tax=Spirosoma rigui TaxID=564064 RepID=UPI0009B03FA3|nr:VOC family protein [Spirosoma rigui]